MIHQYQRTQRTYSDIKHWYTVYPKKYAHGLCFAVLCCGYTLTDFPISIRLASLAMWQSNDCPSASKATLMNMDKYFMWIHYGRLHNHNKTKHNKTVCIFLGLYCIYNIKYWFSAVCPTFSCSMLCYFHFPSICNYINEYMFISIYPYYSLCVITSIYPYK